MPKRILIAPELDITGEHLGVVSSESELSALSPDTNDWFSVESEFTDTSSGDVFEIGDYYWDNAWIKKADIIVPALSFYDVDQDIDTIPEFSSDAKISFDVDEVGQPFTVVSDTESLLTTISRNIDMSEFPFAAIKIRRIDNPVNAAYIRANTPATGRQSQVRMSLDDGSVNAISSGSDTSDPIILQTVIEERSITHYIHFTDPVGHTEMEFAPAGALLDLSSNDPSATGQVGVYSFEFFKNNPVSELSSEFSQVSGVNIYDYGDGFIRQWGVDSPLPTQTGNSTVTFAIPMADTEFDRQVTVEGSAYREAHIESATTTSLVINRNNTAAPVRWSIFGLRAQ